ncbi:LytR/AlgR family response regulator transcription factor [Belliella aquatica]|uniref:DNA-binding response regulator n=1 Tax=Belliella aquatica TaxID=1323734 RepID=A0ABQ1LLJ9_9BACT|nr:LytTR family DNA-binding domain-containing protein [Belliella aquatica]MCH7404258.1 LytTR family DNA-binding domain-containing protein [Belliella aquatica]GGC26607.1 DNA-binding response regulator [Belliella aquatica]
MRIEILIIEDELPARRKLKRYLEQLESETVVLAECSTVEEAIVFFEEGGKADLIISDIALQDGNAFDIYQEIALKSPIIFTTAYGDYMMDAFESNGIDYLLKPFTFERFEKAWKKFLLFAQAAPKTSQTPSKSVDSDSFKSRFIINTAKGSYFLEVSNVSFFQAQDGIVKAIDLQGKSHLMPVATLKEIEEVLDPTKFFRINRAELVHQVAIERMERYGKNNLAIQLVGSDKKLVTSQSSTAAFREWVEQ